MIPEERQALILKKLNENRFVQVSELAKEFQVTTVTIRQDLDKIEADGLCIRKHGGALKVNPGVTTETPYYIKRHEKTNEKERIALEALKLIRDGDTFILDAGSTTYALALLLNTKAQITVVTNDLKIAVKLAENPKIKLVCTGGIARNYVYSLQGSIAEHVINEITVDKTFIGADAIHHNGVISNVNVEEVQLKKSIIEAADQLILLADSSKFTKSGFYKVCDIDQVDLVITDSGISKESRELLESRGVKYIIA